MTRIVLAALWNDYYRDIAVLAFPTPASERWDGAPPRVTCGDPKFDVTKIADGNSDTFASLANIDAVPSRYWRVGFVSDTKGSAKMDLAEVAMLSGARIEDWTGKAMFDKFGLHKPPFTSTPAPADATIALDHHWNSYLAPLFADVDFNRGVACVHIDSYEKHAQNWSPCLPDEFRKRRGYDLIKFLPAMTGRVIDSVETTERFLWDLRQTICDTMADAYYGRMAELCHKQSKLFSVEPYHQVQFDNVTVGGRGDLIVTEFWNGGWPGPYWFKLGASPAHIYGKRIVGDVLYSVAAVRLNGRELGTVWCAPWQIEITPALRAGTNSLEITIANLWPNRIIGDEQLPEDCEWTMTGFGTASLKAWPDWLLGKKPRTSGRYTFASWKHWTKDAPLLSSGLLGPVTIQAIERTTP